jgi:hypothetical protein
VFPAGITAATEAIVLRKFSLLAAFLGVVATPLVSVRAQDQPQSLGDVARQNRKDKEKNTATSKTVLTDDNFGSGKASSGSSATTGVSSITTSSSANGIAASRASGGDDTPMGRAWAGIGRAEDSLDRLAPLDRTTLARVVLEGNDVDFPGRRAWEQKLFVAKETYVARSRRLVEEMKQLMENAQTFQNSVGTGKGAAENPHAQALVGKAQQLLAEAQATEAEFKAVLQEGVDQAKQTSPQH